MNRTAVILTLAAVLAIVGVLSYAMFGGAGGARTCTAGVKAPADLEQNPNTPPRIGVAGSGGQQRSPR